MNSRIMVHRCLILRLATIFAMILWFTCIIVSGESHHVSATAPITITDGQTVSGTIGPAGTVQTYKFECPAKKSVHVLLSSSYATDMRVKEGAIPSKTSYDYGLNARYYWYMDSTDLNPKNYHASKTVFYMIVYGDVEGTSFQVQAYLKDRSPSILEPVVRTGAAVAGGTLAVIILTPIAGCICCLILIVIAIIVMYKLFGPSNPKVTIYRDNDQSSTSHAQEILTTELGTVSSPSSDAMYYRLDDNVVPIPYTPATVTNTTTPPSYISLGLNSENNIGQYQPPLIINNNNNNNNNTVTSTTTTTTITTTNNTKLIDV